MTEKGYGNTNAFQPELDLIFEDTHEEPIESAPEEKQDTFHPHLAALINDMMSDLAQDAPKEVPLTPKTSDDPFYIAQLRARELETLPNLDHVPILEPGLPFGQDRTKSSELMGLLTRNELNRLIPQGIRNNRLAIATFVLTALEHPTLKRYSHRDSEEVVVSGIFSEFDFDTYETKETIVVPLIQPKILEPRFLRGMALAAVKMPVLGIGDWNWTTAKN